MSNRPHRPFRFTAAAMGVAAALALSACDRAGNESDLASLDNQIAGNDADPALTSALEDQILVDPTLANQSNKNAVRPPETPRQAQYPAPQQQTARPATVRSAGQAGGARPSDPILAQASAGSGTGCAGDAPFQYNRGWANRLSPAFAVYPGAQISDAAGNNSGDCRVRVVTFTTGDAPQRVLDWYGGRAQRAGYSAEHQRRAGDHVLGGTNETDGGAYYLIVTPTRGGGSDVALIANNGR